MNINIEVKNNNEHLILFVHGLQGSQKSFYEERDKCYFHDYFEKKIMEHVDIGYLEYHTEEILSKKSFSFFFNKFFNLVKKEPIQNLNIEELAVMATHKIDKILLDYKSINFICHSMGGLIIKGVLIRNKNILNKTKFYITLATPHRGTNKAKYLNGINRQVKSLEEDSQIIKYLTNNYSNIENKPNRHYYRATQENWVLPRENAFPIFEEMHTTPVDCNHSEISKPRHDLYLGPLIYDINKRIYNYLSLNKISKELYNIDSTTSEFSKPMYLIDNKIGELSKSLYMRGLQCKKSLWLKKYNKNVLTAPLQSTETIFEIHNLAKQLFPNGKEVSYDSNIKNMLLSTKNYLENNIQYIYEATFNYQGVLITVDILNYEPDGVSIYEVKSSTSIKDIHIHDVSIQYYVLKSLGFNIKNVNIIHIDNSYVREEELDIHKLFSIYNITQEVILLQDNVLKNLETFMQCIEKKDEPMIDIGTHCFSPYECDAIDYCWNHIPKYSIFDISRLNSKKKFELYQNGILEFSQIENIDSFSISQQVQIISEKENRTIINKEAIKEFLESLTYPIYHLDFETFQQAVPEFVGLSPYQQIPFQYSLHIEYEDGRLEHKEFLALDGIDPREQIAKRLVEDIPTNETVLAYNMGFEKGVIRKLASLFPYLSLNLMAIHDNCHDLMTPFQNKDYYHPNMKGSYSIKYVLPSLVPEFENAYKELDLIHNGGEAMEAFANLSKIDDEKLKQRYRDSLLEYCKLDTLAMVKILEKLKKI